MDFFGINSPFATMVNKFVQMLYAGLLWFVCSIPIITMGASTTALYEVLLKMEKNQEGYVGASFLSAFRKNLISSTRVWIPILVAKILFGVNLFYYVVLGGKRFPVQSVVFLILLLLTMAISGYAFPVLARFENTTSGTFAMCALLAVHNLGWTVVIVIVEVFTVVFCWFFLYFPLLFIMGITGYFQAAIFNRMFDRLIEQGKIIETHQK